jgi:hypothetical protein
MILADSEGSKVTLGLPRTDLVGATLLEVSE